MLTTNTNHPGIIYFFVDVLILEGTYERDVYGYVYVYMYMFVVQGSAFLPQCCLDADKSLAQRGGGAESGKGSPQPVFSFRESDADACQNRGGRVGSGTNAVVPSLLSGTGVPPVYYWERKSGTGIPGSPFPSGFLHARQKGEGEPGMTGIWSDYQRGWRRESLLQES